MRSNRRQDASRIHPLVKTLDPNNPDGRILGEVAALLMEGGVVVFPTETFYALGCNALHRGALQRIYELKSRPKALPLLCLIDGRQLLDGLVEEIPPWAEVLMEAFWPGPLTLVLRAREGLPPQLVGPSGGVAVRLSPNPIARELSRTSGVPIVGTSANPSGEPPPSRVEDLSERLTREVDAILNAGPTGGGVPSTVLDCTQWPPKIIREGIIEEEQIRKILSGTSGSSLSPQQWVERC